MPATCSTRSRPNSIATICCLADFPEVCFPIQALDGISNRANGQLYQGKRTQIGWTAKEIVLPTIAGSNASGAIIKVAGLTGRIRGMKFKTPDGRTFGQVWSYSMIRKPTRSARSLSQCANRESILAGAVLGLAGPGKKISGIMPCTVIRPGDMADNILDRDQHPEWNGERTRDGLCVSQPTKRCGNATPRSVPKACATVMVERRPPSSIVRISRDGRRFRCRLAGAIQPRRTVRDPARDESEAARRSGVLCRVPERSVAGGNGCDADQLTPSRSPPRSTVWNDGLVPIAANHLTAFIDVQQKLLFYVVAAWEDDFTGYVIDYGTYPDQQRAVLHAARCSPDAGDRSRQEPDSKDRSMPASNR